MAAEPDAAASAHKLPLPNRHVRTLKGHDGPVYKVRFNCECGAVLPMCGTVWWCAAGARCDKGWPHIDALPRATADCQYCMTAGHDRTVKLWNPNRESDVDTTGGFGLLIKSYGGVHSHPVHDVAMYVGMPPAAAASPMVRVLHVPTVAHRSASVQRQGQQQVRVVWRGQERLLVGCGNRQDDPQVLGPRRGASGVVRHVCTRGGCSRVV